ncbi:hypothetical protein [Anaerotignum sp.]|uniref:hypothetical protein n=1 Tax=Anaerotignum sp. TaxID=2039241 RepID=UPI0027B9527F|nr:hypothetical protein [Anaerotignum sp.]
MSKYIDFIPETASEEYALLAGRVEAFANYVVHEKYSISKEMCAAMLGFELPTEQTVKSESDDKDENWFDENQDGDIA